MLTFYQHDSKEENYKCFGEKLMQKLEEKTLKKKLKMGTACLAHKLG